MQPQVYEDIFREELTHWWFRARRHIVAALLRRFAPAPRPLRIADVGCGMGASLEMLREFGGVTGIDFSPIALGFSRQRGEPRLVAAALPSLPFPSESFDVVCAMDVIEHIDDDVAAARELCRICKRGGLLVITVPAYQWLWSEHDDINEHKRRYTRPLLRERLAQNGVHFLRLSYMNTLLAPPLMLFRVAKNIMRRPKTNSEPLQSDAFAVPTFANRVLESTFGLEAAWLPHGSLPFGISVVAIAQKS